MHIKGLQEGLQVVGTQQVPFSLSFSLFITEPLYEIICVDIS